MLIEKVSPYNLQQTVDSITSEAERRNWRIPAVHDLQATLAKSGKIVLPVRVIELCKPELAVQLLELNDERAISVMMPCRISVYDKNDGKTYIGMMNAASMAQMMPATVAGTMIQAAEESSAIVESALNPAG